MDRSTHQVPRLPGGQLNRGRGIRCLGIRMPCCWLYAFAMARSLFIISLTSLTTLVPACGRLCLHQKINISTVLAGQRPGIKEIDDGIWLVSFMHYELGYFDLEQNPLQPLDCRHSYSKFLAKLAWSSHKRTSAKLARTTTGS